MYSLMLGRLSQAYKTTLFTYCLKETYSKMSAYRKM